MSTQMTVVGNLTGDPELRFTPSGKAVANFSVAHTPRFFDRQANEWRDGETMFLRCSIWSDSAEHVAASLKRGHRVVVLGRLKARSYEHTDQTSGEVSKRTVFELDADEVGPSLRFAECDVRRVTRSGSGSGTEQGGDAGSSDPWAVPGPEPLVA